MQHYYHRTWAEVDLDQIEQNAKAIRARLAPQTGIAGVIKADAYGHGAVAVAAALDAHVSLFALSSIDEVVQLRQSGVEKPALILGYTPEEFVPDLIEHNVTQTVYSYDYAKGLYARAKAAGRRLKVHVKLDTGMTRLGFDAQANADDAAEAIAQMTRDFSEYLQFEGLFTHFAVSDEPESDFTQTQFARFNAVAQRLKKAGICPPILHVCNSAAILNYPQMQLNLVRPGIILYGLAPCPQLRAQDAGLRPALSLKTVVSQVHAVSPGTTVSYGRTFAAQKAMTVATLPIGYADGYSRKMSGGGAVLIHGKRAPIVGRVCMDQCIADVSEIPDVRRGDAVTLIGTDGAQTVSADDVAARMGTINYEVTCLIGKRVPRIYLRGGKPASVYSAILK